MFDIITAQDFLSKLEADHTDFKAQPDSARHALNCIITAYHLHEWIWGDWLRTDHATWAKLGIRDKETFAGWLTSHWPGFVTMRDLANGAKHFINSTSSSTGRIDGGCGKGPWGVGPYARPYLLIDLGPEKPDGERYRTAEDLVDEAIMFWRTFFDGNRPENIETV